MSFVIATNAPSRRTKARVKIGKVFLSRLGDNWTSTLQKARKFQSVDEAEKAAQDIRGYVEILDVTQIEYSQ